MEDVETEIAMGIITMNSERAKRHPCSLGAFVHLLDRSENLRCVVKDRRYRYLYVNQGWLLSVGIATADEVVGRTAMDLFPAWRAERYMREDCEVIEQGRHFDYEELSTTPGGGVEHWRSLKSPWMRNGRIVGVTGLGMRIEKKAMQEHRADVMPRLVEWMTRHACESRSIGEMAQQINMSRRSLERHFHEKTGESPANYRTHCRMERAKTLLRETGATIVQVAAECGYCDQSHFSRVFCKTVGMTPKNWQKKNSQKRGKQEA